MSENQNSNPRGPQKETDLLSELREMGQQLEAAFRAAVESDRAKQLQNDIAGGVRELTAQLKTAVKTVQSDPRFQQAGERGRQAVQQARESKVVQDIQETVVSGLTQLNDQLRRVVERIEKDVNTASSGPATQNVPVEHEPPATGETTRLDEDEPRS